MPVRAGVGMAVTLTSSVAGRRCPSADTTGTTPLVLALEMTRLSSVTVSEVVPQLAAVNAMTPAFSMYAPSRAVSVHAGSGSALRHTFTRCRSRTAWSRTWMMSSSEMVQPGLVLAIDVQV